jgi:hypothetical protein
MQQFTTSKEFGDSLSVYKNIEFISADSPEDLRSILAAIKLPYSIVAMYSQGSKHFAWIVPSRKVIKKIKIRKGDDNGSISET